MDHRRGRGGLLESVADSLILWSLSETNPDTRKLLSRNKILDKIEETLPSAKQFIRGVLDNRLEILSAKDAPGGRQIRAYRKTDEYCLPYETRLLIAADNADDDIIKLKVSCVFEDRLTRKTNEEVDDIRANIVLACHSTLERVFEHQGLKMAQFATNGPEDDELYTDVANILSETVGKMDLSAEMKGRVRRQGLTVLRGTFYESTEIERTYLQKLSRTYVLLLLLKNEPKIVEYFRSVAGSFYLYIGTDLIIRALSEHYLAPEDQATVNLLKILKDSGATIILTAKCVEEVASHFHSQILEFRNHYERFESKIPLNLVEYIDRILIRSYFYARLAPVISTPAPLSWRAYIGQFANYGDLLAKRGDQELADYLINKFGFVYESIEDMERDIDKDELEQLTATIHEAKTSGGRYKTEDDVLAYNDALQVLRVYAKRRETGEESPGNPFGYQTWWVTQDVRFGVRRREQF